MSHLTLFIVLAGVPLLFGFWAQRRVKKTFDRWGAVPTSGGLTGAAAAERVLATSGLAGLSINRVEGRLSDHYDPRKRTLNLSDAVGGEASVAALGVAAHEAGHAIQHANAYWPMQVRQTLVPAAQIGSTLWIFPVMIGMVLSSAGLVTAGLVLFAAIVVFQLVTLPVEFDASKRAMVALEGQGLLVGDEVDGARKVLNAAALTYVAGFVAALGQLVYFFIASRD